MEELIHTSVEELLKKRMLPENPYPLLHEQFRVFEASCVGRARLGCTAPQL